MSQPQRVTRLVEDLAAGRVEIVDLTQPLGPATPVIGLPPMFAPSPGVSIDVISRYDARGPAWYWNTLRMGEHTGTHFDAPVHWVTGKDLPNNACDTIPVERFVGPACVIDVTADVERNEDFLLTPDRILAWETQHGRVPARAWVLLRTGWSRRTDAESFLNVRTVRGFTRIRQGCWRATVTCWASASKRSAPTRGRPAGSIRHSRTTRSCTARASSDWRACAISINCRRPVRS